MNWDGKQFQKIYDNKTRKAKVRACELCVASCLEDSGRSRKAPIHSLHSQRGGTSVTWRGCVTIWGGPAPGAYSTQPLQGRLTQLCKLLPAALSLPLSHQRLMCVTPRPWFTEPVPVLLLAKGSERQPRSLNWEMFKLKPRWLFALLLRLLTLQLAVFNTQLGHCSVETAGRRSRRSLFSCVRPRKPFARRSHCI